MHVLYWAEGTSKYIYTSHTYIPYSLCSTLLCPSPLQTKDAPSHEAVNDRQVRSGRRPPSLAAALRCPGDDDVQHPCKQAHVSKVRALSEQHSCSRCRLVSREKRGEGHVRGRDLTVCPEGRNRCNGRKDSDGTAHDDVKNQSRPEE
ncbi:uncharacterized protein H6S33_012459 [Morchella sextelata]|uniref:uncharacterized protein n=1 Tax=Morchella sextelata TaxID=1174677 RepID=UPI001D042B96|nr:uncharacterized protein H6S33_012459 [Morchella sextelata]KAH0609913.1 hypothetical protein H6S33_012459 [Morchella sextelata]